MNYINSIVSLRGIASLSVCIFHLALGTSTLFDANSWIRETSKFGYLGVEIFFIISGFVVPYSMMSNNFNLSKIGGFLTRRSLRVEIPYIFSILLVLSLNAISYYILNKSVTTISFNTLIANVFYLPDFLKLPWILPVYYTLKIEFQYYILIGLLFTFFISNNKFIQLGAFASLIGLSFFDALELFSYLPLFLIGIATFLYKVEKLDKLKFAISIIILLGITFKLFYLEVLIVSLFSVLYILYVKSGNRLLNFLGKISFSLYLVHIPIGGKIVNLGLRYITKGYQEYILFLIALLTSIGASYIFYLIIESPAQKISKKIKYNIS